MASVYYYNLLEYELLGHADRLLFFKKIVHIRRKTLSYIAQGALKTGWKLKTLMFWNGRLHHLI